MHRRAFIGQTLTAVAVTGAAAAQSAESDGSVEIAVIAELVFKPEQAARAAAALQTLAIATRREPGCRRYVVTRAVDAPGHFHLSELWIDRAALAHHFRTAHMTAFLNEARPLGYETPVLKQIEIAKLADLDTRALLAEYPA